MSSVIGIVLRLGALLSLPVRRAGRVLLHPRGLLSRADLLAPESRKVSSSRRSNGRFFTSLPERCACGRSLAVERLSAITVEAEADGPAKSWQLAVGSWQLDVAIANGPSFRSAMAEDVTIDRDVVCATSSSLLTAPSWSSRDWWMVDGLLRLLWRWSSERTRWSEGFWVLGSGFCLDSVSTRSEWSAPPRAVKGKSTEYVRRMGLPPTTSAGCDSMDLESSPYGSTPVPGRELGAGA
jgi:hypothetical protein